MKTKLIPLPHPGETLLEDFMKPLMLTQYRVAKDIGVPQITISQILHGKRGISPQMAIRLGKYTRTGALFWINLQGLYDLRKAEREHSEIAKEVQPCSLVEC